MIHAEWRDLSKERLIAELEWIGAINDALIELGDKRNDLVASLREEVARNRQEIASWERLYYGQKEESESMKSQIADLRAQLDDMAMSDLENDL